MVSDSVEQALKSGHNACRKPQQERAKAKYDAILQAAIRVLVEEGYRDASTVKIAQAAGVSVGTVYAYFADKDEIFSTYVDTQIGEILSAIASNVSMASYATVEEGIRDVIDAAVTFTMNNKRTLSAMVGKIPGVYDGMMLRGIMPQLYAMAEQFFRAHGLVRNETEARRLTYVLSSAVTGFFIRFITDPDQPLDEEEIADELVALMMGYVVRYRDGA
jgi:AcrR family transcriptional regulator